VRVGTLILAIEMTLSPDSRLLRRAEGRPS
jgi:hypothetical protein